MRGRFDVMQWQEREPWGLGGGREKGQSIVEIVSEVDAEQPPKLTAVQSRDHLCVQPPRGGACTPIAVNLAVALRQTAGQKTILVDGDLGFGDVDSALDMTPTTSVATLLPDLDEIDDRLLDRMPVSHSAGIKVLLAPPYLDAAEPSPTFTPTLTGTPTPTSTPMPGPPVAVSLATPSVPPSTAPNLPNTGRDWVATFLTGLVAAILLIVLLTAFVVVVFASLLVAWRILRMRQLPGQGRRPAGIGLGGRQQR